ncbi:MAG TPA: phage major capsid protein [Anaerolineae bacterium]|nr:phage major capsid protein [Anaerolineae bacterium]HQI85001.1 phage major capsid protein [Anaerolineae bacterium]
MPYLIVKQDDEYCVYKEAADGEPDGATLGCHSTVAAAEAQRRALYAAEDKSAYKATLDAAGRVGGYGVVFTGPQAKDLQGDYFAPDTNLWLEHYPVVPLLYQHGQDQFVGKRVIGTARPRRDDIGVWYEAQLQQRDEYEALILELVKAGALGYSTGSLPHLVERAPDGKLLSWPVAEITLTPTPAAGPYLTSVSAIRSVYKSAGIENHAITDQSITDGGIAMEEQELESKIKGVVDAALAPYLTPKSETPPASTPEARKAEALKAFNMYLATGSKTKALEEGEPGEGGYLVPEQYYAEVVRGLKDASIIRAAGARVIQMTSDTMEVPTMTQSTAAVIVDEEGNYSDVDPSFGHVTFTPFKFTKLVKVSEELAADAAFDMWGQVLAPDFQQAFAAAENTYFTTGDGTTGPQGVVTGAGTGVTAAAVNAITADEVIDLYYSLNYLYRGRAVWMMNDAVLKYVRKLVDGSGNYLWTPGLQAGQPDMLLGRPVITNNAMAATLQASAKVILFADFSYYWIGQRAQMTVDRNPFLYMYNGQIGYFARMRVDGNVMLQEAFKLLVMKA